MGQLIYLFSCFLSCMIGVVMILQYLDDRYKRAFLRKWIYWTAAIVTILVTTLVNQVRSPFLNMMTFFLCCGLLSVFFYTGGRLNGFGRIIEAELFFILLGIIEGLSGRIVSAIIDYCGFRRFDNILYGSIEVVLSKVLMLFVYYILLRRLWKKNLKKNTREYLLYFIMFVYCVINMVVVVRERNQLSNYIVLCVNWGCLIMADIYSFYYMRMSDEKESLDFQLSMMKQQESLQFEYYEMQKEKYDQSISILHDVNKHIRAIEELYNSNKTEEALAYTKEINGMLKPLIPMRYSDNAMFDILLSDQKRTMDKLGISFQMDLAMAELGFIEPVDVTTLFGNLFENAMEACKNCTGEKIIQLEIKNQHDMIGIRIENTVEKPVHLMEGKPVHPGEKTTGIGTLNIIRCVEKYSGSILYKNNEGRFICDILLNK